MWMAEGEGQSCDELISIYTVSLTTAPAFDLLKFQSWRSSAEGRKCVLAPLAYHHDEISNVTLPDICILRAKPNISPVGRVQVDASVTEHTDRNVFGGRVSSNTKSLALSILSALQM